VTGEEEAGVLVGDRERVAVEPVACSKLPLEICGPVVVRYLGRGCNDSWVLMWPAEAAPAFLFVA